MCELFGVSSLETLEVNAFLKEFYSHSINHPNGWGLAVFHNKAASVEKEPIQALQSRYLKERLRHSISVKNMIAHIRLATIGAMDYENCHPFVQQDNFGRQWTLVHNGTMFHCPVLDPYFYMQEGNTDSERILYYFIAEINRKQEEMGYAMKQEERFHLLDKLICNMAAGNKLNLIFYDGELMYIHSNYANSLYYLERNHTMLAATVPLDHQNWNPLPFTTLLAWQNGRLKYTGTCHGQEYIDNEKDTRFLYMDSALL